MKNRDLMENIAAISAVIHGDQKKYEKFYNKYADDLDGFVGIWYLAIDAAEVFTKAEKSLKAMAGTNYEWLDAITSYGESIIQIKDECFTTNCLKNLAVDSIQKAKY